jgi:hypothetical protein
MNTVLAVSAALMISGASWAGMTDGDPLFSDLDLPDPYASETIDASGTVWQQPVDSRQVQAYRETGRTEAQPSAERSPRLQPPSEDFPSSDERCRLAEGFGTWSSTDGCTY